jgi:hypothetical protein
LRFGISRQHSGPSNEALHQTGHAIDGRRAFGVAFRVSPQVRVALCCKAIGTQLAINQASFFLYPPRFGPSVELDHSARTVSGEPLRLVGSTLVDPNAPSVKATGIRHWLEARGFVERERYGGISILVLRQQKTFLGVQGEVELSVPLGEVEIQELYIRFLPTEETPAHWNDWEDLIVSLGSEFAFKIMGPDDYLLPWVDFFTLLTNNENFGILQSHYNWSVDRAT